MDVASLDHPTDLRHADQIIKRAKDSGQPRGDFEVTDLVPLFWAMSEVIRKSIEATPNTWRRLLACYPDGLRIEAGTENPAPLIGPEQFERMLGSGSGSRVRHHRG